MVITLIKILLFGKVVLLTASPITIDRECVDIIPDEPLEAITSGASLQIDVSSMFVGIDTNVIKAIRADVRQAIPKHSIVAELYGEKNDKVKLYYDGNASIRSEEVWITLGNPNGVPIGYDFKELKICAEVTLENARLVWKNYKH